MNFKKLFAELKRRNVFRVATAYAIAGWLIIQVATSVFPAFDFPDWTTQFVIILVIAGLPIALIIAWAFELTPEGLKKSKEVDIDESLTRQTGKKINAIIIGVLSVALIFMIIERVWFAGNQSSATNDKTPVKTVSEKSIAVLPFDDFNSGDDQEYFADGLTEEILNSLAKTPDLLVASRTSSFQYKDKNIDIVKIADTLGVAHVLEGSVRESTEKYRITAQLIRASDGFHLWSETYDRQKADIIDIQEDIAYKIATALETAMDPAALRNMLEVGTSSIEAYTLYMEGLSLNVSSEVSDRRRAFELFEESIAMDDQFASAYYASVVAILTDMSLTTMGSQSLNFSHEEKLRMLDERLSKAIRYSKEIDKLQYLATQAFLNMELRKAADYLMQYIDQRPSQIESYRDLIFQLISLGEYEKANEYHKQVKEYVLDNAIDISNIVAYYFWSKKWSEADPWMQDKLDKYPYNELLAYQSHRLMLWRGEYDRAREIKKRLKGLEIPIHNFSLSDLRQACADGNYDVANRIYSEKMIQSDIGSKWIALKTLGRDDEAHELIKPLDEENRMINLSAWLYYPYFDYHKYPNLKRILEQENHKRGEVIDIPFRCGR